MSRLYNIYIKLYDKFFFWFTKILTKFFIKVEIKRQNKLSTEFKRYNLWNLLSNKKDEFIFLDLGFMPTFEYRIEEYFKNNSQFYGIDGSSETKKFNKKKNNEIIINKMIVSKEIPNPIRPKYLSWACCEISGVVNASDERNIKMKKKNFSKLENEVIDLKNYFKNINLDFIKSDLDTMDMITLHELEDKFKSKDILGILIEVHNGFEHSKVESENFNSFDEVFKFMNRYNYRLFEQTNVRMMRKSARKYKYHKIYDDNNWVNSEKGQIIFGDMLFFLDPRDKSNQISHSKMKKLVSLLDCYDLSDVAHDFLQNSPKYFDNAEVTSKIEEILEKRIESNYKNYNPLNLREIYLRGSINKNFE
tara:strand:+ start:3467 stop:4552 length:1086 start_codon:yes stop_codon:yes gene_type:complete